MPMLTSLAGIARGAGLAVSEYPGWRTRGHGQMGTVRSVMCHHTATTNMTGDAPSLGYVARNGLAQFVLARSGRVHVVAAGLCWHAGVVTNSTVYGNPHSIGIEAENNGTGEPWPAAQMAAYRTLCRALIDTFGLSVSRVVGHREAAYPAGRKIDPTFNMAAFRSSIASGAGGGSGDIVTPEQMRELKVYIRDVGSRQTVRWVDHGDPNVIGAGNNLARVRQDIAELSDRVDAIGTPEIDYARLAAEIAQAQAVANAEELHRRLAE